VLPAATWYEKYDLSSTDMHPFVHAFTPAVDPPWEARSDFDAFTEIARRFSELARTHLGTRRDLVATALGHDTHGETAQPFGEVHDWRTGDVDPVPGRTMPGLTVVERDYTAIAEKMATLGPLVEKLGLNTKGVTFHPDAEVADLAQRCGVMSSGAGAGRPALDTDAKMAEAILALSGTTNGRLAVAGFEELSRRVGRPLSHLAAGDEERRIRFADTQAQPVATLASPEWSGSEAGGRRYAPFSINVEELKPWHTLTGRMHFVLDHEWMREFGEVMPIYRPPLDITRLFGETRLGDRDGKALSVRYLTPHSKWSIHSEYQDNLLMLSLSRGGPNVWMNVDDAAAIGVADNDWVEAVNRNGVLVARAVVTHRMPPGTVFVHHAQERLINVPKSETDGRRGGIHNSLTRVLVKPTHLIGGYAQLSFGWNYLGPTGNQRDEVTVIRRRSQEVQY
jgi:nitrate reductase alpha subunit